MAEEAAQERFHAILTATDEASKTLSAIKKEIQGLGAGHEELEHKGVHAFSAISGHLNLLHSHFGEVRASIGEIAGSLGEFLPLLAGLGAAGSLAGLFEITEKTAELQAELGHTAAAIGITSQALQRLNFAAKMTDTSQEAMQKGMEKLNKAIGEGAKNKQAAALFQHLGIATRDARGHLKSAADLLPQLADAFAHTQSAAMRTRMAMVLMGKGGVEMVPMLMKGREELEKLQEEAGKVGHVNTPEQAEALEAYADSMKQAQAAVQGFGDTIGADLAPVLKPILDAFVEWVVVNRDWIASDIAGAVKQLGDWLAHLDLKATIQDFTDWVRHTADLVGSVGGLKTVLIAVGLLMGAEFSAKIIEAIKVMKEMSEFIWGPVIEALGAFGTSLFATRDAAFALDMALDANPFGVFLAAVAVAGVAAYELWQHWAWVKIQFSALYAWFSSQSAWVQGVLTIIAPFIGVPMLIMEHWTPIKAFFIGLWNDIKAIFHAAMGWIEPIIAKIGGIAGGLSLGNPFAGLAGPQLALPGGGSLPATSSPVSRLQSPLAVAAQPGRPGAPGASGQTNGRVNVDVHLVGAPPGTKVSAASSGSVATTVRRSDGQAWNDR